MKLELKRIEFSERLSQETKAFAADLWVNGKKVAYCENDGHGGCTNYNAYDASLRPILKEVEEYCKSLPSVKYEFNGNAKELKMDLEFKIDIMLDEWLEAKDFKKLLIYKTADGVKMECSWKGYTLTKLLGRPDGIRIIQKKVLELQAKGCKIMNTNLGSIL